MCRMTKGEKVLHKKWSKASSRGRGGSENFSCEYKGVRQRTWGKWVAEIRDPWKRIRVWLGSFNTKEEAAAAYDRKVLEFFGPNAHFNLQSSTAALQSNQNTVFTPLFSVPLQTLISKTDSYSQPQVSEISVSYHLGLFFIIYATHCVFVFKFICRTNGLMILFLLLLYHPDVYSCKFC